MQVIWVKEPFCYGLTCRACLSWGVLIGGMLQVVAQESLRNATVIRTSPWSRSVFSTAAQ